MKTKYTAERKGTTESSKQDDMTLFVKIKL